MGWHQVEDKLALLKACKSKPNLPQPRDDSNFTYIQYARKKPFAILDDTVLGFDLRAAHTQCALPLSSCYHQQSNSSSQ